MLHFQHAEYLLASPAAWAVFWVTVLPAESPGICAWFFRGWTLSWAKWKRPMLVSVRTTLLTIARHLAFLLIWNCLCHFFSSLVLWSKISSRTFHFLAMDSLCLTYKLVIKNTTSVWWWVKLPEAQSHFSKCGSEPVHVYGAPIIKKMRLSSKNCKRVKDGEDKLPDLKNLTIWISSRTKAMN